MKLLLIDAVKKKKKKAETYLHVQEYLQNCLSVRVREGVSLQVR